ncbi:dna replication licensing factor mcm3 [Vairimorpha apis BRL 01]|uniref:DNA replication licensing factor MCM3 n=1 Tax=Vairimorpha apis BRL 01 TaxID=1037528 RepID=T0L029_9MICR|nr:dna replication licensing factor mcm3 [Vairimorpha apis BRL 01]
MNETLDIFRSFLTDFKTKNDEIYTDKIIKTLKNRVIFNIDEMRLFNLSLAKEIINDSTNIIPLIEDLIKEVTQKNVKFGINGSFGEYKLSPRTLSSLYLGKLICVEGIITSCSICRPKIIKSVHFNNYKSSFVQKEYRDSTMITKLPITNTVYPTRDTDGSILSTEYGMSEYIDYQTINLQEMPENAPCGQLPRSVECILSHDLVDTIKPGDRVKVYGIYKSLCFASTEFPNKFKNILIANNIEQFKKRKTEEFIKGDFNINNVHKFIAPSIWGHDNIKKALALMLVGGNEVIMKNGSKIRGDINILLIGDPSTAKSQLLRFIYNFNEISVATTGKGSSGVGLTAAVVIDKDTGDKRLEAGAMVLADRGIVCIDEFDKMNELDRVAIHEVMEQQTVTISKAGIHTTLNARCSVLAAANPIFGIYKEDRKPSENIKLPESIMTRFDLIFVVLDKNDTSTDTLISDHVVKMHSNFVNLEEETKIGGFKEFIVSCKNSKPVLSRDASQLIIKEYTKLRQLKNKKEQIVSITPRMLETIIRLSTAHAKLRCSSVVESVDIEEVILLLESTLLRQVVKPTKRVKNTEDIQDFEINKELEIVENENAKKDYVINLLYEIRLGNESLEKFEFG